MAAHVPDAHRVFPRCRPANSRLIRQTSPRLPRTTGPTLLLASKISQSLLVLDGQTGADLRLPASSSTVGRGGAQRLSPSHPLIGLFSAGGWMRDGQLLEKQNIDKIRQSLTRLSQYARGAKPLTVGVPLGHIPTVIAQGRYDVVCPATTAWALKKAFPEVGLGPYLHSPKRRRSPPPQLLSVFLRLSSSSSLTLDTRYVDDSKEAVQIQPHQYS